MSEFITYYTESNIICLIIFGIILVHDLFNIDRQEKQIKFDHALIAFMCYFVSDTVWAMVIDGVIPKTPFTVVVPNFANYLFMAGITYTWLVFVMAFEQTPGRNVKKRKIALVSPFILATVALIMIYVIAPSLLLDETLTPTMLSNVFLVTVPIIYIAFVLVFSFRKAYWEPNPIEQRKFIYVGSLPLLVVVGGLVQVVLLPRTPIFCFCCAILMLIFNILSMDNSISLDPLTGLSNRGQFMRLVSQKSSLNAEGRRTFIVMIDINDFKAINDTYGHAEGDHALVIVADSLKKIANVNDGKNNVIFVGRYGGDEFIIVVQSASSSNVDKLIEVTREQIAADCDERDAPYIISIGAGYGEMTDELDSFKYCMQNADSNMYLNKKECKKNGRSTVIRRNAD